MAITLQLDDYENFDIEEIQISNTIQHLSPSIDEIITIMYDNYPDIKSAQMNVLSAEKQTEIVKTLRYPSVHLIAGVSTNYLDNVAQKQSHFVNQHVNNFRQKIAVNVRIPIFNKGITKLQIQQSEIREHLAKNNLDVKKQVLKQQIQTIYFDIKANYERYLALLEVEKSTQLAYDFAQKSFGAGRLTIYDLNKVRNNYINAQKSLIQAKYNYIFSLKVLNFYIAI